ncbi:hypothetical protein AAEU28_19040 [Pseudoalteromonas sp. SS15]|uniref:hypothetical protein n=1 Tax=Pseudoalteromonas sp. SS15 TaxID=3139393 RepID=UPI003BAA8DE7
MKLYRGVSKTIDELNNGRLVPKSDVINAVPCAGEDAVQAGAGFECGEGDLNSCIFHQYDSSNYKFAWVSTSKSFEIAKSFAKHGGNIGYVYTLDTTLFEDSGVIAKDLNFKFFPIEQEISIREKNGNAIPSSVIIDKVEV